MRFTDIYPLLGRAVARRRETLGLTQAEVGERIGLTRASVANIETGRQKVLLHHVYMLADALQFDSICDLVPEALATALEPLTLSTDKVTFTQKAQVMSVVRQALIPAKVAKRR